MEKLQSGDPRQVGGYTVLGRLGANGMGQAFLGKSAAGKSVMVRVIHPHLAADPGFRARFAREAEAAHRVDGAYIAPLIDFNADAPLPWLVSDYVDGPSLATAVAGRGPLSVRSVLTLAAGLAEALSAAHAAEVVHGDLNPASVLLAADGPRLIDFGITRAVDRRLAGIGMPEFMAPEQAAGLEVGPASDMFSLGAVLLYATTGTWMSHFVWHLDQLPGELRPFIERCMAADPARRPTARELLAELPSAHTAAVSYGAWPPPGIQPTSVATYGAWPAPGGTPAPASTTPYGAWPAPGGTPVPAGTWTPGPYGAQAPAPPFPAETVAFGGRQEVPRRPGRIRRHAGLIAIAALAVAVAITGAVYVIHPWPYPVLRPAGLTADQRGPNSISLSWSPPASGPLPDKYVILQDGITAGTVPGNVDHFKKDDLAPATAYDFQVVAYRGGRGSQASPDLRAATQTPPLSEAVFNSDFSVTEKLESGGAGVTGDKDGDTWNDDWTFSTNCDLGPCVTHLSGAIDGEAFNAVLKAGGDGNYSGSVPINNYYYCGNSQTNYTDSTLMISVTPVKASAQGTQWRVSKLKGGVTWEIDANPNGNCGDAYLVIGLSG